MGAPDTTLRLAGAAVFAPGIPSVDALFDPSARDPEFRKPVVDIVASRMKRATSIATRAAVHVVVHAARQADWPLDSFATVFASQHGEIQIAVEQMRMMREDNGIVSPARFKNSVHNTAAGMFSIGATNRGFTSAIAAGDHSFPLALLEAWMLLASGEQERAVVSIVEEPLPEPITEFSSHATLAVAVALDRAEGGTRVHRPERLLPEATQPPALDARSFEGFEGHTAEGALRILACERESRSTHVSLSPSWCARVDVP